MRRERVTVQRVPVLPPSPGSQLPVVPCTAPGCRWVMPAPPEVPDRVVVEFLVRHLVEEHAIPLVELTGTHYRLDRRQRRLGVVTAGVRRGGPLW